MGRLNQRAYRILKTESDRCPKNTPQARVQHRLLGEMLDDMRNEKGDPSGHDELRRKVRAFVPNFSIEAINRAAAANQPKPVASFLSVLGLGAVAATVTVGVIAVANLPYPMIRRPVANTAPLLLLPSFFSMDRNYRAAIANVEQADQLIDRATSGKDIERGAGHVAEAQTALDRLPVWFLGYEPRAYCTVFTCSWRFTYDEFESARKQIARLEARVFQERNALDAYEEAKSDLEAAQTSMAQAESDGDVDVALGLQQLALDNLLTVPQETIAGQLARQQAETADRTLAAATASVAQNIRTSDVVEAAKGFAMQAAVLSQNPPHAAAQWREVPALWEEATTKLEAVQPGDPSYREAQAKLAEYKSNISTTKIRLASEESATAAFDRANDLIPRWQALAAENPKNRQLVSLIQQIITQLDEIEAGTTPYANTQTLKQQANAALATLRGQ
ncbi:MAG: hypothetical protein ACFB9N_17785 [Geitlerinemataceae cyanobacterium]